MMLAHTASSYTLAAGARPSFCNVFRLDFKTPVATAFGSVVAALNILGAKRIAFAHPMPKR